MYPNPTSDEATISLEADEIIKSIEVIDIQGRSIDNINNINSQEYRLILRAYTYGLLTVRVTSKDGEIYIEKLIKT